MKLFILALVTGFALLAGDALAQQRQPPQLPPPLPTATRDLSLMTPMEKTQQQIIMKLNQDNAALKIELDKARRAAKPTE